MIPIRLRLRNFMCYRGDDNVLDLSGVHLACLAGDNGHGKSALLDAMTWALWGKSRARRDDDLISQGETEMEAQLDYRVGGNTYRVIRKRTRAGRGRSILDLQMRQDDRFVPMSGDTLRATEAEITKLLHLDYDTFINTAFLLQGRADEFTTKAPGERKRILGEILGLDLYERYEERAKTLARECKDEVQGLSGALQEVQREIEKEPEHVAAVASAEEEVEALRSTLEAEEEALQSLRETRRTLEAKKSSLAESGRRVAQAGQELTRYEEQRDRVAATIQTYRAAIERRDEILEGYEQLGAARTEAAHFANLLGQIVAWNEERAALDRTLAQARHDSETKLRVTQSQIAQLARQVERRPQAEEDIRAAQKQIASLADLQQTLEQQRAAVSEKAEESARLKTTNEQLKQEMAELREKLNSLEAAEAQCPLCGQALTEEHATEIRGQYETEGRTKGDLWRQNRDRIAQLQGEIGAAKRTVHDAERRLREQGAWQRKLARAEQALSEAEAAEKAMAEAQAVAQQIESQLAGGEYAQEARARLESLEAEIAALGYSQEANEQARRRADELAAFEDTYRDLQVAQDRLAAEETRLAQLQESCARWQGVAEDERERVKALEEEIAELEPAVRALPEKQRLVSELQGRLADARLRLGAARQRLDYCRGLAKERDEKQALLDKRLEEQAIYEELRLAFGQRGLRAMIIESVLPEIEEEANRILARMTDGRMSVRFETQRETLKGTVVETLDIHIADELGTRDYQMYSGGEAFRANFAIRVALSKLLARRAGARLQTLVIDEGFGTQDAQGRERLTEAINAIRDDFERVLVITHIDELKDIFPVRIDVVKTPAGTRLSVT